MYTFKKWNGKYGKSAKFIVEDDKTGKQTLFAPSNPKDLMWTDKDLTVDSEAKQWEGFKDEKVQDLNEVVF